MILLDTNALIWLHQRHARARPLARLAGRLHVSPATLLELQFLIEAGRLRLRRGAAVGDLVSDERWVLDDPSAASWFETAITIGWTRDPFDRLIVANARMRDWRLATGDLSLVSRLGAAETLSL